MNRSGRNDNTKTIIGVGFAAIFTLMLLVSGLSMSALGTVNDDMRSLIHDADEKTGRAYQMRDAIRLRSGAARSLTQIEDRMEREKVFDKLTGYTRDYSETRTKLAEVGANRREQAILDDIELAEHRVDDAYDRAGSLLVAQDATEKQLKSALSDVQLQELVLLNHLNTLVALERTLAQEALEANQSTYRQTRKVLLTIVILSFAFSLLISGIVTNRVSRANRRIAHMASHDDLTGLHNRRSFEQHLHLSMNNAKRFEDAMGLMYLDLDRFKIVNDTCGHHAGDQLLIQITELISSRLRSGDLFARLGGDEFGIVARADNFEDIQQLAEVLRNIVADYSFQYDEQAFKVSLSIGLVPVDGREKNIEKILADVDSACYVAKQSGRNCVHVMADDDAEVLKYRTDIEGVKAIRAALAQERLSLFFQPVFAIKEESLSMAHCEILLRIRSENGELYSPAKFIPIAEKYNVMSEIDRWVFNHVIEWLQENQDHHQVPKLLVNLSGLSFIDDDFCDAIAQTLASSDVDATRIVFEISESAVVGNYEKARLFIARVQALGCQFALDDFGSGMSALAYLKLLSVDYLKINGSLVSNMINDSVDQDMVSAINQISHSIGAETIAEFVEDDDTLQRLRTLGVDYAQGYGLRMPSPLSQLVDELSPVIGDHREMRKAS